MQGKAAGDEMSERLAEQTREIATLRAQLAAAPSLDVDDMGGMSLGESLGGELEAEALAPPPVAAVPDALTAEMRTKLARAGVLEGEVEELQQKVERLESELQAQDDAKGARPIHTQTGRQCSRPNRKRAVCSGEVRISEGVLVGVQASLSCGWRTRRGRRRPLRRRRRRRRRRVGWTCGG